MKSKVSSLSRSIQVIVLALGAHMGPFGCATHNDRPVEGPTTLVASVNPSPTRATRSSELAKEDPDASPLERAKVRRKRGLEPAEISAVVRAGYLAFGGCQALDADAQSRDGVVTVDWIVRPDGTVNDVSVIDSSFGSAQVDDCVADVARGLRFPEAGSSTRVAWKVRFQAQGGP
jgi:TonB family protein